MRGWAHESLLDIVRGRAATRGPAKRASVGRRVGAAGRVRDYLDDVTDRITHNWTPDGRSTLDLLGDGFTILAGPEARVWDVPSGGAPASFHRVQAGVAAALGLRPDEALLVRPDGRPAGSWAAGVTMPAAA